MKYILFAFSFLFCCVSQPTFAQVDQKERVEYDLKDGDNFQLYSFKTTKKALVMYTNPDPKDGDNQIVTMQMLNEKLVKTAEKTYSYSDNYRYRWNFQADDYIYSLHFNEKKGIFKTVRIDSKNFTVLEKEGDFQTRVSADEVVCVGDYFFVSTLARKQRVLFVINATNGQVTKQIPDEKSDNELVYNDMQVVNTPTGKEVSMRFIEKKGRKILKSLYFRYDATGKPLGGPLTINNPDEETQLRVGSMTKVSENKYVVAGTYSKDRRGYANGMYLSLINQSGNVQTSSINFLDIKNFISYLPQRKQEKIEKKKDKAEAKGDELNLDYLAAVHDVIERQNEYILVSEFYYPTYITETYTTTNANGGTTTHTRQIFDGFQYTHAAVMAFDRSGKIKWSDAFEMFATYKPFNVRRFIEANTEGKDLKLTFLSGSSIQLNTFDANGNSKNKRTIDIIKTGDQDDKVKWTFGSDIQYWYGQSFLGFGEQKIKNKEEDEKSKRKRKVFFVNKVSFQ